tara:strand:- start:1166 stop:1438 length:273 start_codon:yes stop_codon:yes gene_type:complete
MNGNEVFGQKNVLVDAQNPCPSKIDNTVPFFNSYHLANAIVLRRRAIVDQIPFFELVFGASMKREDHREEIESVTKSTFLGLHESKITTF